MITRSRTVFNCKKFCFATVRSDQLTCMTSVSRAENLFSTRWYSNALLSNMIDGWRIDVFICRQDKKNEERRQACSRVVQNTNPATLSFCASSSKVGYRGLPSVLIAGDTTNPTSVRPFHGVKQPWELGRHMSQAENQYDHINYAKSRNATLSHPLPKAAESPFFIVRMSCSWQIRACFDTKPIENSISEY